MLGHRLADVDVVGIRDQAAFRTAGRARGVQNRHLLLRVRCVAWRVGRAAAGLQPGRSVQPAVPAHQDVAHGRAGGAKPLGSFKRLSAQHHQHRLRVSAQVLELGIRRQHVGRHDRAPRQAAPNHRNMNSGQLLRCSRIFSPGLTPSSCSTCAVR